MTPNELRNEISRLPKNILDQLDVEAIIKLAELLNPLAELSESEFLTTIDRISYFGPPFGFDGTPHFHSMMLGNLHKTGEDAWKIAFQEIDKIKNFDPPFFPDVITSRIIGEWSWTELRRALNSPTMIKAVREKFVRKYEANQKEFFNIHTRVMLSSINEEDHEDFKIPPRRNDF